MLKHIETAFQCICAIGVTHFAMPATTWARSRIRHFRSISSVQLRVAGGLSLSYTTLAQCLLVGAIVALMLILGASASLPGVDGALDENMINNQASYYAPEFALVAACLEAQTCSFLCDSGCSSSTCNQKALFDCLFPSKTRMLTGDNVLTTASGVGNVSAYSVCTTKGKEVPVKLNIQCLYMPNFAYNLLSVNSMNANGYGVYFPPAKQQGAYIEFDAGHRIYLRKQGKLWYLDMTTRGGRITQLGSPNPVEPVIEVSMPATAAYKEDRQIKSVGQMIHEQMGHLNFAACKRMCSKGLFGKSVNMADFDNQFCHACSLGNLPMQTFPNQSSNRATTPFGRVATDIAGPFPVCTVNHQLYYQVYIDEFSGNKWTYLMRNKSLETVMTNIRQFRMDAGCYPAILRLDNDSTFTSHEFTKFCNENLIKLEYCQPYRHQQNGLAERAIRSINATARVLMIAGNIPERYWGYAVTHAAWSQNRMPRVWVSSAKDPKATATPLSPYQLLTGRTPNMKLTRVFGSTVYALDGLRHSKMSNQAVEGRFLGYCINTGSPSALILTRSGRIFRSRDLTGDIRDFTGPLHKSTFGLANDPVIVHEPDDTRDDDVLPLVTPQTAAVPASAFRYNTPTSRSLFDDEDTTATVPPTNANTGRTVNAAGFTQVGSRLGTLSGISVGATVGASAGGSSSGPAVSVGANPSALSERNVSGPFTPAHSPPPSPELPRRSSRNAEPSLVTSSTDEDTEEADEEIRFGSECGVYIENIVDPAIEIALLLSSHRHRPNSEWDEEIACLAVIGQGVNPAPINFTAAMASPESDHWMTATKKEYDSLISQQVFDVVPMTSVPTGVKVISCMWIYKVKPPINHSPEVYKARLVAMGNQQKVSDFEYNFAPVCRYEALRLFFLVCVSEDVEIHCCDVQVAFLNALIPDGHEDIYMHHPQGFGKLNTVCKLKKCLYGLRDSPRLWNETIHRFLVSDKVGLTQSKIEPCLYYKQLPCGGYLRILLYVDDVLIGGKLSAVNDFKELLMAEYSVTDHGDLTTYVGLEFTRDRAARTGKITMTNYINKVLTTFGMIDCNAVGAPYVEGVEDIWDKSPTDLMEKNFMEKQPYRNIVACLLWISNMCRSELSYTVKRLSHHYNNPSKKHLEYAKRALAFLKGSADHGIIVNRDGQKGPLRLCMYSDADWASCRLTRKSTSGVLSMVDNTLITWRVVIQKSTALSTMEAEYMAMCENTKEAMYLRSLLKDLQHEQTESTVIYEDNDAARFLSKDPKFHTKSKHIDIQYHYSRDKQLEGHITVVECRTSSMLADYLTKFVRTIVLLGLSMAASGYAEIPSPSRKTVSKLILKGKKTWS